MKTVGLFEAKNKLSALVERASRGETILITRRGRSAAMLVPSTGRTRRPAREVIEHIRRVRKGARLPAGTTVRRLIELGRRF